MSTWEELCAISDDIIGEARKILGCVDRPVPELLTEKCRETVAELARLREENARLRELLEEFLDGDADSRMRAAFEQRVAAALGKEEAHG